MSETIANNKVGIQMVVFIEICCLISIEILIIKVSPPPYLYDVTPHPSIEYIYPSHPSVTCKVVSQSTRTGIGVYYDMMLSQSFQPMAVQLSVKAALPLAKPFWQHPSEVVIQGSTMMEIHLAIIPASLYLSEFIFPCRVAGSPACLALLDVAAETCVSGVPGTSRWPLHTPPHQQQ